MKTHRERGLLPTSFLMEDPNQIVITKKPQAFIRYNLYIWIMENTDVRRRIKHTPAGMHVSLGPG